MCICTGPVVLVLRIFRRNPLLTSRMVTTQERGNAWYSMGKLGLAMKNREHLTPAVQMFMEYLPFREMAE